MEANVKEKLEKIDALEREKAQISNHFQGVNIANEIEINELKLKVGYIFLKTVV